MKAWIITALVVLILAGLAVTASLWLPDLLSLVAEDSPLLEFQTNVVRVGLWLLAALAGAFGVRQALDQHDRAAESTTWSSAAEDAKPAGNGDAAPPRERIVLPEDLPKQNGMVSFYTSGGVRIVADSDCLEMEDGTPVPESLPLTLEDTVDVQVDAPAAPVANQDLDQWQDEAERAPAMAAATAPAVAAATAGSLAGQDDEAKAETPAPLPVPVISTPFNLPADLPDFTGREPEIAWVRRSLGYDRAGRGSGGIRRELGRAVHWARPRAIRGEYTRSAGGSAGGSGGSSDNGRDGGSGQDSRAEATPPDPAAGAATTAIAGIAGMGGIGKTALALHVGHQLAAEGHFPDGQIYIDLKGTEPQPVPPAAALDTLLSALQGPDPERPGDEEALAELWRAALQDKEVLLVLDNAADADQVSPLLPASPTSGVLVTSRLRFKLPGADLLDLDRLTEAEARALLQGLAPRLKKGEADEIARLCGGLPLALRIAGNHLAVNDADPPEEYAALLADERERLDHLRDPENPDQDVVACLSLSMAQLAAGAHWAWTVLALFPGTFDAAAAAAAWGEGVERNAWDPLARELTVAWLRDFRNRSLVTHDPQTGRYHLHDLLHLTASQALEHAEEVSGVRARLAYHYLVLAQQVDEEQRYRDLDPDWPNLQEALRYAKEDARLLSDLTLALNDYWSARGMVRARSEWSQRAAKACAGAGLRQDEGAHLGNLGSACADGGDARQAIEYYGQALAISRRTGDRRVEGTLLGDLGSAYAALGDARRAVHYHEQALQMARENGDRRAESAHLGNLGSAYADLGEPRRAVEYHEQALAIAQEIHDGRSEGAHLGNLGLAYADLGDTWQAIDCQKQALAIHREIGDLRGEAYALDNLGRAYTDLGDSQRAVDYFEQALEIARRTGDKRGEGTDLANLGSAYASQGDTDRAIAYYEDALEIAHEIGDRRTEGACLGNLGSAYVEQGDVRQAMDSYGQALEISREIGDRRHEGTWLGHLGQAHARLGDVTQATDFHEQALAIYQEIGDRRNEGNHLANLGMLAKLQGDQDRAREVWTESLRTFQAVKDPSAGRVYHWLAELDEQPA